MKKLLVILFIVVGFTSKSQVPDTIPAILLYSDTSMSGGNLVFTTNMIKQMKGYIVSNIPAIAKYLTSAKAPLPSNLYVWSTSMGAIPGFIKPNTYRDTMYLRLPLRREGDTLFIQDSP